MRVLTALSRRRILALMISTLSIAPPETMADCHRALQQDGLFAALRALNATTSYRFTGIYRFEGRWVKSVWLFDRQRPEARFGSDVLWDDSYCRLTAEDGANCEIVDALSDQRLTSHAARQAVQSYVAVLLNTPEQQALGTLCHYDVCPRSCPTGTLEALQTVSPLIERALWSELRLA